MVTKGLKQCSYTYKTNVHVLSSSSSVHLLVEIFVKQKKMLFVILS